MGTNNHSKMNEELKLELKRFLLENYSAEAERAEKLEEFAAWAHPYIAPMAELPIEPLDMGCSESDGSPIEESSQLEEDFEDIFKIFSSETGKPAGKAPKNTPRNMLETIKARGTSDSVQKQRCAEIKETSRESLKDYIEENTSEDSFSRELMRLVDERELTDPKVYNSIFMDRRLYFKIRSKPDYQPSKETAIRLAIALHLTYEETQKFIAKAGYTLTKSKKMDLIIEFCMKHDTYDIMKINDALDDYGIPPLL